MAILKATSESLDLTDDYTFTGKLSGHNYPAFQAYLSDDQTITDNTVVKINIDTEDFDTDNCYDNSTNYRFTPNKAGKYYVYASIRYSNSNTATAQIRIHKNGNNYKSFFFDPDNSIINQWSHEISAVIPLNGSTDYIELFAVHDVTSGTPTIVGQSNRVTAFGAYRIGS